MTVTKIMLWELFFQDFTGSRVLSVSDLIDRENM